MESLSRRINRGLHVGRILLVLALPCAAAWQPAFGQTFTVKDLGALPGGTFSVAMGINDHGQIVGASETNGFFPPPDAFLFENGVMEDLGTLPGFNPFSEALGINNHGEIVGSSDATNAFLHATLWTPAHEQHEDGVPSEYGH